MRQASHFQLRPSLLFWSSLSFRFDTSSERRQDETLRATTASVPSDNLGDAFCANRNFWPKPRGLGKLANVSAEQHSEISQKKLTGAYEQIRFSHGDCGKFVRRSRPAFAANHFGSAIGACLQNAGYGKKFLEHESP